MAFIFILTLSAEPSKNTGASPLPLTISMAFKTAGNIDNIRNIGDCIVDNMHHSFHAFAKQGEGISLWNNSFRSANNKTCYTVIFPSRRSSLKFAHIRGGWVHGFVSVNISLSIR